MTSPKTERSADTASTLSLSVEGMSCASCVGRVERALKAVPGIDTANVNLATERADISFSGAPNVAAAIEAIERTGYHVAEETIDLAVSGMTCASCVGRVERALSAVPGVNRASVNLATERAQVTVARGVTPADLVRAVAQTGYEATPIVSDERSTADVDAARREAESRSLKRALGLAAILTLPVFILEMGSHFIPGMHHWIMHTIGTQTSWLLQFALTTIVLFGPGMRFFTKGVPALVRAAPDMNSMVAVGTAAAWG